MKKLLIIFILLSQISAVKANTIYNLIKIPNLEIYKTKTTNKVNYLNAKKSFLLGVDKNIRCLKAEKSTLKEKFPVIEKNFNKYTSNFLKKIQLKYIVMCKNLSISNINTAGVPNHKMKTLILDIKFEEKYFERVIHHEIFHIINDSHKKNFDESEWKKFNNSKFKYADCSTCTDRIDLSLYKKTNGFLTEYSMTTPSEDMAEIFSFLMTDKKNIENKSTNDPILYKKISFIKKGISKIDNKFRF